MAVSRRRSAGLLTGMRLGDMAAALDSRRMRRAEERDDMDREQMRLRAGGEALRSIIGGYGEHQERTRADERQATQDARQAKADAAAEAREAEAAGDRATARSRTTLAQTAPGRMDAFDDAAAGGLEADLGVPLPQDLGESRALGDAQQQVAGLAGGISEEELDAILRGELHGARDRSTSRDAASAANARREEMDQGRIALLQKQGAATEDLGDARKALAELRRRPAPAKATSTRAPGAAPAAGPKGKVEDTRTVEDFPEEQALPKHLRAPDKLTEKMLGYETLKGELNEVMAAKDALRTNTGPVQKVLGEVANFLGIEDVGPAGLRAMTGEVFARYVQSISGAAASDKEIVRLMKNMATMRDQDDVFATKIKIMTRLVELRQVTALKVYQQAGQPLGRWGAMLKQPSNARPAPSGDVVMMRPAEGGDPVPVPRARVGEAIKRGASIVLDEEAL